MNSRNIISISILIIAISIAYYFVIFLPKKEQERIDQQKQELDQRKLELERVKSEKYSNSVLLDNCLNTAENNYRYNWNRACSSIGSDSDCSLPTSQAKSIDEYRKQEKETCFKKYPQT